MRLSRGWSVLLVLATQCGQGADPANGPDGSALPGTADPPAADRPRRDPVGGNTGGDGTVACIARQRHAVWAAPSYRWGQAHAVAAVARVFDLVSGAGAVAAPSEAEADIVVRGAADLDGYWGNSFAYRAPCSPRSGACRNTIDVLGSLSADQARRSVMHEVMHYFGDQCHLDEPRVGRECQPRALSNCWDPRATWPRAIYNLCIDATELTDLDLAYVRRSCAAAVEPPPPALPRPYLTAPPDNEVRGDAESIRFTWASNGSPRPLVWSLRRCQTPQCAGDGTTGPTRDESRTEEWYEPGPLAPGDYRWTVYYPDSRCPEARCAAQARVFTVRSLDRCGDGVCSGAEDCASCASDCRCACRPGASDGCTARATGECAEGSRTCLSDGTWGTCRASSPRAERCNGLDDDCDGAVDEDGACGAACVCASGACCDGCNFSPASRVCATAETYRCNGAIGGSVERQVTRTACPGAAAACSGPSTAGPWELVRRCGAAERCTGGGAASPACVAASCAPGATGPCPTGRPGACAEGRATCSADGAWGACGPLRAPAAETCNGADDDCDGAVDEDGACGPRCGDGACNGGETCGTCAGDCGPCPTACTLELRETSSWNLETDHFSHSSGAYPVGTELNFGIWVENPYSTRSYEFSRSRVELVSGDSVQLVTASEYDDRCISPHNDRYFSGYSLRLLRPGTTALRWGGRYRYYLHDACSTVEPNSYREEYDEIEFEAVVTCR